MESAAKAHKVLQFNDAVDVANRGIVNDAIPGLGVDRRGEIVAYDGTVGDLAIDVSYIDISGH